MAVRCWEGMGSRQQGGLEKDNRVSTLVSGTGGRKKGWREVKVAGMEE